MRFPLFLYSPVKTYIHLKINPGVGGAVLKRSLVPDSCARCRNRNNCFYHNCTTFPRSFQSINTWAYYCRNLAEQECVTRSPKILPSAYGIVTWFLKASRNQNRGSSSSKWNPSWVEQLGEKHFFSETLMSLHACARHLLESESLLPVGGQCRIAAWQYLLCFLGGCAGARSLRRGTSCGVEASPACEQPQER